MVEHTITICLESKVLRHVNMKFSATHVLFFAELQKLSQPFRKWKWRVCPLNSPQTWSFGISFFLPCKYFFIGILLDIYIVFHFPVHKIKHVWIKCITASLFKFALQKIFAGRVRLHEGSWEKVCQYFASGTYINIS